MPWKATGPMDQRLQFLLERRTGTMSMAACIAPFGVSRQTGYQWLKRFSPRLGAASLQELSRRPHASPSITPPDVVSKSSCRPRASITHSSIGGQARFFISSALAGEIVGVHYLDHRYAEVAFGPISLGLIDCTQLHRGLLRPRVDGRQERFRLSTMSPV